MWELDEPDETGPPLNVIDPARGIRVLAERCATCIFRPGNPMDLAPGRVKGMVAEALDAQTAIICHDTLRRDEQAVCRGFFDAYDTVPLRLARRLRAIVEVEPPPSDFQNRQPRYGDDEDS